MAAEHKVVRGVIPEYFSYRGVPCERVDSERGYAGHFRVRIRSTSLSPFAGLCGETRKQLLARIDAEIEKKAAENACN